MFEKKTIEELEKMTPAELQVYKDAEAVNAKEEMNKAIADAVSKSKPELSPELKAEMAKEIQNQLLDQVVKTQTESYEAQLKSFLKENEDKIKSIHNAGAGAVELTFKAVADISTANGVNTLPPNITGTQQAGLSNVNLRDFDVTMLTTNVNTSLAAFPYTEALPKDGDYTFVAEGAIKPQVDFTWETNYAKPVKAAAWIKLTEESVKDVAGLESVARDLLVKKHNIKKAKVFFTVMVFLQTQKEQLLTVVFSLLVL